MTKNIILDEKTRARVAEFLPRALTVTMQSYDDYMSGKMTAEEKKEFESNHKAAKVAISHIELLLKLAGAAELPREDGDGMELAILIQQASAELDKYQEGEGNE